MSEWQPIETAPKDETLVDLWVRSFSIGPGGVVTADEGRRVTNAKWGEPYYGLGHPRNGHPEAWIKYDMGNFEEVEMGGARATHWMPLPPPPQDKPGK